MKIILYGTTSLQLWRTHPELINLSRKIFSTSYTQELSQQHVNSFCKTYGLQMPVSTLVTRESERAHLPTITCRITDLIPSTPSLIEIEPGVFIPTPEFALLQLAKQVSTIELARLISEFCGTYSPLLDSGFKREPLTSIKKCGLFINHCGEHRFIKKFKQALDFSFDNSGSARETATALILSLPYKYGGFNLEKPILNHEVKLNGPAQNSLNKELLHVDLFWPDYKLGLEYNSDERHLDSEQNSYDSKRINGLGFTGYNIYTLTTSQINSYTEMNCLAQMLAKNMGRRLRPRLQEYDQKQHELRELLLGRKNA